MKIKQLYYLLLMSLIFASCSSDKIKEKINKTGDVAGQAVGEFATGVGSGVEKTISPTVQLHATISALGLSMGEIKVESDSLGEDNMLVVYFIFNQYFNKALTATVINGEGKEMGRSKQLIIGKKSEARFIEFHFDKHTNIDKNCTITIE